MPTENKPSHPLLYAGSIGYALAFAIWAQWLLLALYGYVQSLLGNANTDFPGGIYILYLPYHYSTAVLLPLAFGFSTLGWLGIYRAFRSKAALTAGISSSLLSLVFIYSAIRILIFTDPSTYLLRPFLIFIGTIFWGSAILEVRTRFNHPSLGYRAAIAFLVSGVFGISFLLPAVLYLGLEYWFALLGWLYAIATLAAAYSFLKLKEKQSDSQPSHPKK